MKSVVYRKYGLRIADAWFATASGWNVPNVDLIRAYCCSDLMPHASHIKSIQNTLITDLALSETELLSLIDKKIRYEINRAEKEEIQVRNFSSEDIVADPGILDQLKERYDKMFSIKGMQVHLNVEAIRKYAANGMLYLSLAYLDGSPVVFHSYVAGGNKVRCWHSCSTFRDENDNARTVGRANKYLHWKDLLYFKAHGYAQYDWGGVFNFTFENGIDHFKASFGGKPETYFKYEIAASPLGSLYLFYLNLSKKRRQEAS